jgi:hypothetical protein
MTARIALKALKKTSPVADHNYYFSFKDERVGHKNIYFVTGPTNAGRSTLSRA